MLRGWVWSMKQTLFVYAGLGGLSAVIKLAYAGQASGHFGEGK